MSALFTDLDCGVAVNSSLQRYPIIGDQHHSSNIRTALEKESLLAHWSWCCLTNTWILWKTSFTWSVILLTELLLWHFIISVAAVLLLWSGQLTRNFNFTNGHWFPIAGIVYCLCAVHSAFPRGSWHPHFLSSGDQVTEAWWCHEVTSSVVTRPPRVSQFVSDDTGDTISITNDATPEY